MSGRLATDEEIQQLLKEIEVAFRGVKKGVSWSESRVIDSYGTSEERGIARAKDKDKSWLDVALDPDWDPEPGTGGWTFLHPHGFRYYMAALMTKALLERDAYATSDFRFDRKSEFRLSHWAEFDNEQLRVVAEFILLLSRLSDDAGTGQEWRRVYENHWQKLHSQLSHNLKSKPGKKGK